MNRSELETKSRKQLLAMVERAGISVQRGLGKAGLIELLLPVPSGAPRPEEAAELPATYGRTRLMLVEIEPHWIHAYWEITAPDREAALAKAGDAEAAWVLRFYDITGVEFDGANARDSFDVPVDVAVGNWYVNLWSSGKSYCGEIGLRAPDGSFVPVSRSGIVQVPAAAAAPRAETEWMKVEPLTGETAPAGEPAREEAPVLAAVAASVTSEPEPVISEAVLLPATEQAATPGNVAEDTVVAEPVCAAIPETFPLPPPPPTVAGFDISASPSAAEINRWCEEIHAPPDSDANNNDNGSGYATVDAAQPASQESPAAERETAPSSHSVERFGTASDGLGVAAAERAPSIKLELNAEIVIYGRAMPGQTVEVCGRMVKVSPDGTFSVRMALPLADDDVTHDK
ncbi:MAG: DUF4912 domain-containing protein [Verrucomicrobiia bacterium]